MASDPKEAVEFLRQANDAESENRQNGLKALQFRYGDQWPAYAIASRGLERPQLTINEMNTYIKKVTNAQRQQRPRGKASPVDSSADKEVAKIITGIGRHVEVNSDADNAYDTAFDFAATIGWGYWRLRTDYISEDSFNQDIFIDVIDNPFCVYFDPNSRLPDGSDSEKALITDLVTKDSFKLMYPGAQDSGFSDRGTGDSDLDWVSEQDIRLAEYMFLDRKPMKLVMLDDGSVMWADEIKRFQAFLLRMGIGVKQERDSMKRVVKWRKQTSFEVLEEKDLPGRWIPVVPMYWTSVIIDSRRIRQGLVKDGMDPQRMVNFWNTAVTESLALAPKAKWLIAEGQDEGFENDYKNANLSPNPVLRYKVTDSEGKPVPPPQRLQPEPPPAGMIEAMFTANQNLSRVMGVFDPAVRGGAQHKSDKTLNAERSQSENTNFDGYDNLTRSIKHSWRIMLSYIPVVFDTERVQRIIGEDGREQLVTINQKKEDADEGGNAIEKVLNDVCVGTYDVVMETGPGYDTLRQEGVATMMQLLDTPLGEKVAAVGDDLIIREMDFNGSDTLADRMAAANPMAQIDEGSEIPPKVQMQIKGLQMQLKQAGEVIQGLQIEQKFKLQAQQIKEEGATKRALMKETNDAHEREITQAQKQHDTEVYALTAQNVAEINGLVKILTSNTDKAHEMRKILATFEHEMNMMDIEQQAKHIEEETLGQGQTR